MKHHYLRKNFLDDLAFLVMLGRNSGFGFWGLNFNKPCIKGCKIAFLFTLTYLSPLARAMQPYSSS
jgi:hypothetical protein